MADKHFNKLTPAEHERLAILSEELGEAQQAIGKILRHGYESVNPHDISSAGNRCELAKELGDVRCAVKMLTDSGDLAEVWINRRAEIKRKLIKQYLHHQPEETNRG